MQESGTLAPQQAFETILDILAQAVQLFDGSHIFVNAPKYHWHAQGVGDMATIDKEVREHIILIASSLDRFGHRIE